MGVHEALRLINSLLDEGHEVRIKLSWLLHKTHILKNGETVATLERTMLYPGYLNITKAGTPTRVLCVEDCGGFLAPGLEDVKAYQCCCSHRYNDYDRENWYDPDEGGEDRHLDQSYEKE